MLQSRGDGNFMQDDVKSTLSSAVQLVESFTSTARNVNYGCLLLKAQIGLCLPEGVGWLALSKFFEVSTDTMTKAALGQFMVEILHLL